MLPRPSVTLFTRIVERTFQAQLCEQIQFMVSLLSTMVCGPCGLIVIGHCRERMTLAKSPLGRGECSGVLTFQQVISGAVSPQYTTSACVLGGQPAPGELRGSSSALAVVAEDVTTSGLDATADSSDDDDDTRPQMGQQLQLHLQALTMSSSAAHFSQQRERGVGESSSSAAGVSSSNPPQQLHGSSATIAAAAHFSIRMAERQRLRTSSMPAESRKVSALRRIA